MNLGEALQGELDRLWQTTAIKSPITSNRGRLARMQELERQNGGPAGAAAAVGVSRQTWRRWGKGAQGPSAANLKRLGDAYERAARPKRLARLRSRLRNASSYVKAEVKWTNSTAKYNAKRHRPVNLDATDLTGLIAPWEADNRGQLAEAFEIAISKEYQEMDGDEPTIAFEGDDVTVRL